MVTLTPIYQFSKLRREGKAAPKATELKALRPQTATNTHARYQLKNKRILHAYCAFDVTQPWFINCAVVKEILHCNLQCDINVKLPRIVNKLKKKTLRVE